MSDAMTVPAPRLPRKQTVGGGASGRYVVDGRLFRNPAESPS